MKENTNPFFKQTGLLRLYNSKDPSILSSLFREIKDNKLLRTLFHVISFDIGSIVNRSINGDKSPGGQSINAYWTKYLSFLIQEDPQQFIKFLPAIVKYVGWRELLSFMIRTQKGKKTITSTWGVLGIIMKSQVYKEFLNFVVKVLTEGKEYEKLLVFKYLHIPRFSKRRKKDGLRSLQVETVSKMKIFEKIIIDLSGLMGWKVINHDKFSNFIGFKNAKREYQQELVDYLFSTGQILDKSKVSFEDLLNRFPAGARYKSRRIVFDHENKLRREKYANLHKWFLEFEKIKEQKQQEVRNLNAVAKTRELTFSEKLELEKVKKEAKITVGANNLAEVFENVLLKGRVEPLLIEQIAEGIKFAINVLPLIDISGSMSGLPIRFAQLALALVLKNNKTSENLFATFSTNSVIYSDVKRTVNSGNKYMIGEPTMITEPLYDHKKSFYMNYSSLSKYLPANGSTNVSSLASNLKAWVDSSSNESIKSSRREQIAEYPVILIMTDSDFNNAKSAEASLKDFKEKMLNWFGWDGVILLWAVPKNKNNDPMRFENINNVIFTSNFNLNQIDQVFRKLNDLEAVDIYTELESLFNNSRYNLVKSLIV